MKNSMRNPDYRAMYEKVCEKAQAKHDAVASPQTQKAIQDNKARRIGNAIETPNKRSGTPTEPPKPQVAEEIQQIGDEMLAGMSTDELWQLMAYIGRESTGVVITPHTKFPNLFK